MARSKRPRSKDHQQQHDSNYQYEEQASSYGHIAGPNSNSNDEAGRPRRPNPDTIAYLRGLPLDATVAAREWNSQTTRKPNGEEEEDSGRSMVLAACSAVEEISEEIGSLAGDEGGSQHLEVLSRAVFAYYYCSAASDNPQQERELEEEAVVVAASARRLVGGLTGYALHLSCHRYASHVMQTLLGLAGSPRVLHQDAAWNDKATSEHMKDAEWQTLIKLPTLETSLLNLAQELVPNAMALAQHVCGSHVLRTLLCVLAGAVSNTEVPQKSPPPTSSFNAENVQVLHRDWIWGMNSPFDAASVSQSLSNKKKKKKKKRKATHDKEDPNSVGPSDRHEPLHISTKPKPPSGFAEMLTQIVDTFVQHHEHHEDYHQHDQVQALVYHPSGGPLLILLLRVLAAVDSSSSSSTSSKDSKHQGDIRLGILPPEAKFSMDSSAYSLVQHILSLPSSNNKNDNTNQEDLELQTTMTQTWHQLSHHPCGSRLLETILSLSPDALYDTLLHHGPLSPSSSSATNTPFSLRQAVDHPVAQYVIQTTCRTLRNRSQVESLLKTLLPLVKDGTVLQRDRRGVFWRLVEMAAHWKVGQESLLSGMRRGFGVLKNASGEDGKDEEDEGEEKAHKKKKKAHKDKAKDKLSMEKCILQLLNLSPSYNDNSPQQEDLTMTSMNPQQRFTVDVAGARAVYHLLRFVPRLCQGTLEAIVDGFTADMLQSAAMDGFASKCLMDGILTSPHIKTQPFPTYIPKLLTKLQPCLISLALHRVGHYTVLNLFKALPTLDHEKNMADILAPAAKGRLRGNAMGRKVVDMLFLERYLGNVDDWREAVKKQKEVDSWLDDVFAGSDDEQEKGDEEGTKGKRKGKKRKRRRKRKSGEGGGENEGEGE